MKKKVWTVVCLLMILGTGCGNRSQLYFEEVAETTEMPKETEPASTSENTIEETTVYQEDIECCVYICGAVEKPGVYCLPAKSRIYEVVLLAGGLTEEACEDSINQAEEIIDGQMIKVLTKEEASQAVTQISDTKDSDGRININTASADELMTLPGIGSSKAESILSYREEQGGFSSIEELMNITGIKEGVYSKIKDHITVN